MRVIRERVDTNLTFHGPESEMEVLAWSALSEDEIVERIAAECWRYPPPGYVRKFGVTLGVIKAYVDAYAVAIRGRKKKVKLARRIQKRAEEHLQAACERWADSIQRILNHNGQWPPSRATLSRFITQHIGIDARNRVTLIIARRLNWD